MTGIRGQPLLTAHSVVKTEGILGAERAGSSAVILIHLHAYVVFVFVSVFISTVKLVKYIDQIHFRYIDYIDYEYTISTSSTTYLCVYICMHIVICANIYTYEYMYI